MIKKYNHTFFYIIYLVNDSEIFKLSFIFLKPDDSNTMFILMLYINTYHNANFFYSTKNHIKSKKIKSFIL